MVITNELEVLLNEDIRQLKNNLLEQVRERARQKIHTLVKMGYRPESGSPSHFMQSAGLTQLHELWITAQHSLDECQALNNVNS